MGRSGSLAGNEVEQTVTAQTLFDLSPLWRLLLVGAALACVPLLWLVWHQPNSPAQRLRALAVFTLFLTLDLLLFGAFTRLTDSGLGCPDWPGCYGHASPMGANRAIAAAQSAMPSGPVTHTKAWIEMLHRYFATGVGALIVVLTISHWRLRAQLSTDAPRLAWSVAALVWVCVQGAFGALTVTMKLYPAIVTLHLLGGVILLALLTMLATRFTLAQRGLCRELVTPQWRFGVVLVLALLGVQIALGGWVSSNYAVLVCTEFPLCQGSWWPQMDFAQGFFIWRPLGLVGADQYLSFQALTAIHVAHRLFAVVVLVALGVLAWQMFSIRILRWQAIALTVLMLAQLLSGLSNVVLGWPLLGALLHTGGAAGLVMVLVWAICATRVFKPKAVL